MTSKLSTLAATAAGLTQSVEAAADASLTKLNAAQTKANDALAKLDAVTATIDKSGTDIENFVNQLTNGGPPLS